MTIGRREFVGGAAAFGLSPFMGCAAGTGGRRPLRFLFMTDHHVESDFVQSHGLSKGEPVYEMWKPGDHAALVETYRFINEDVFCRDVDFALFGGDQLNTGYAAYPEDMAAELANYHRTLKELDVHVRTRGAVADLDFVCEPLANPPVSRVIALQGNHDTGVREFYRNCAFTAGGVRFIGFFASYVGLPPPPGKRFHSTAKISDETIAFVEKELRLASANPAIRHIVLCSHWAIAPVGENFVNPIVGPCKENGMNANRDRLLSVAERYGCRLFINGHEHNGNYPVGMAGKIADINCGTVTAEHGGGSFAIVEIDNREARFHVYSRAYVEERDGKVAVIARPRKLFVRKIEI